MEENVEKIAQAVRDIDRELQNRGEEGLTSVQKSLAIINFTVASTQLRKDPSDFAEKTMSHYQGNIKDAIRFSYSKGMGLVA